MNNTWNDNSKTPISKQHKGVTFLIRLKSGVHGITHTDDSDGVDYTIDITWVRNQSGAVSTTGVYSDDQIAGWKTI